MSLPCSSARFLHPVCRLLESEINVLPIRPFRLAPDDYHHRHYTFCCCIITAFGIGCWQRSPYEVRMTRDEPSQKLCDAEFHRRRPLPIGMWGEGQEKRGERGGEANRSRFTLDFLCWIGETYWGRKVHSLIFFSFSSRTSSTRSSRPSFPTSSLLPTPGSTSRRPRESTSRSTRRGCRWKRKGDAKRNSW